MVPGMPDYREGVEGIVGEDIGDGDRAEFSVLHQLFGYFNCAIFFTKSSKVHRKVLAYGSVNNSASY